jgi:hypothetical protein
MEHFPGQFERDFVPADVFAVLIQGTILRTQT